MGIHPYGLFGTNESNNPFGSDYELRRQLATRQAQLSALSSKDTLSSDEEKRKNQLTNAVNQLSNRINKTAPTEHHSSEQNKAAVKNTTANTNPNAKAYINSPDGVVIAKTPSTMKANPTTPSEDYLKGFFLDIKI